MIELKTVLVLGAGASRDFGFPTGEELLRQICDMIRDKQHSRYRRVLCELAGNDDIVDRFYNGLAQADEPSVDAWLENNQEFVDVGRWAIAMALLEAEGKSNLSPEKNWYKRLFRGLSTSYEKFRENKLKVITFNYDRSLEKYLSDVLPYKYKQQKSKDCLQELKLLEVYHIYGSLGLLEWQCKKQEDALPYGASLDYNTPYARAIVRRAAGNIYIPTPDNDKALTERTAKVLDMIDWAEAVYFLGFGFHEANLRRLNWEDSWAAVYRDKKLMGTAYKLEYEALRTVEEMSNGGLGRMYENLVQVQIDDFLRRFVRWNEIDLPNGLPDYEL